MRKVGVRRIICQEATERINEENGEQGIKENLKFVKKWNNDSEALVKGLF